MNTRMTMARRTHPLPVLCSLCAFCVLHSSTAFGLPTARTMYLDALAREQPVRAALAAPDAAPAVLPDVRAVVAAYEAVARRHPASGYSDNALWQGGRLALDAFARFGQVPDRDRGVRLLLKLMAMFPR